MLKLLLRHAALGSFLLLAACGESPAPVEGPSPTRGDPTLGKKVAMNKCVLCHKVEGRGGVIGPTMDEAVARVRKHLGDYSAHRDKLKVAASGLYAKNQAAIDAIAAESDRERRFALWMDAYIPDPQFDGLPSKMAAVPLSDQDRADVIAYLREPRATK